MQRSHYSKKEIAVYDAIGSFFVDVFYNDLYLKAKSRVNNSEDSGATITDAYRQLVLMYMNGVTQERYYKGMVQKLSDYYRTASNFGTIVFSEFEDKVLACFIPPEYYRDFTSKIKDQTLFNIIVRTVHDMGALMITPEVLRMIIDQHDNVSNITFLQDKAMDIFILQRENYYAKFAEQINKKKGGGTVEVGVLNKLKDHIATEVKRRVQAEADLAKAVGICQQLTSTISAERKELEELRNLSMTMKTQWLAGVEDVKRLTADNKRLIQEKGQLGIKLQNAYNQTGTSTQTQHNIQSPSTFPIAANTKAPTPAVPSVIPSVAIRQSPPIDSKSTDADDTDDEFDEEEEARIQAARRMAVKFADPISQTREFSKTSTLENNGSSGAQPRSKLENTEHDDTKVGATIDTSSVESIDTLGASATLDDGGGWF